MSEERTATVDNCGVNVPVTIRYLFRYCYQCGTRWAIETGRNRAESCPVCGGDRRIDLEAEVERLKRSNAALRGAATRRRK